MFESFLRPLRRYYPALLQSVAPLIAPNELCAVIVWCFVASSSARAYTHSAQNYNSFNAIMIFLEKPCQCLPFQQVIEPYTTRGL
ncbi:hypothetical protein LshimejAT787_1101990 [Lyophyllum shimeji]|uniref:Uncharacterized protein n=1 Tax=Lyophyllum shimeji TaxID=47721 RepID=A0A9P3PV87_LYOSH|nr:hypothetical protein LshimejAT787_1101990 [Lyophyllum shimeji]